MKIKFTQKPEADTVYLDLAEREPQGTVYGLLQSRPDVQAITFTYINGVSSTWEKVDG